MSHPKKVGALPIAGSDELKQTNEIGMFIPVLDAIEIRGKTVTGDALLTQRKLAHYLVSERSAHYVFTVKDNQPTLLEAISLFFSERESMGVLLYLAPPDWLEIDQTITLDEDVNQDRYDYEFDQSVSW